MSPDILNFRAVSHVVERKLKKRDSVFNFGGSDNKQEINGNNNHVGVTTKNPATIGQETLLRKTAHQIGRIFESGADLANAPAQWINSIQQNWYEFHEKVHTRIRCVN
jgi:hypothetical protein